MRRWLVGLPERIGSHLTWTKWVGGGRGRGVVRSCTVAATLEKTNTSTRDLLRTLIRCGTTPPHKLCDSEHLRELIYETAKTGVIPSSSD